MISEQLRTVQFVKAVEARPCLWDNTSRQYRNKQCARNAWGMISAQFLEPVDSCRDRWRNIRNAFLRSMKRPIDEFGQRREYYLSEHLQFLQPYVRNDEQAINHESDTEDVTEFGFGEDIKPGPFLDDSSATCLVEVLMPSQHPSRQRRFIAESTTVRRYKKVIQELPTFDKGLPKKRKKAEPSEDDDHNVAFFKSLLADVRQMTDRQNRTFRVKVMRIVTEILDGKAEMSRDD